MKSVSKEALRAFKAWGQKGGKKRARSLSSLKRAAISRRAAQMRWGRLKSDHDFLPSVRLREPRWDHPVYLEEVLLNGNLKDWKQLYRLMADHPFGAEAEALEKLLRAVPIYGATPAWRRILGHLRGES